MELTTLSQSPSPSSWVYGALRLRGREGKGWDGGDEREEREKRVLPLPS